MPTYPVISTIDQRIWGQGVQGWSAQFPTEPVSGWAYTQEKGYNYINPQTGEIEYSQIQPEIAGSPQAGSPYEPTPQELERSFATQVLGKVEENYNKQYDLARRAWDISDSMVSGTPDSPATAARMNENYRRFQEEEMQLKTERDSLRKLAGEIFKADASFNEKKELIEGQVLSQFKGGKGVIPPSQPQKQLTQMEQWQEAITVDAQLKDYLNQRFAGQPSEINRYYRGLTKIRARVDDEEERLLQEKVGKIMDEKTPSPPPEKPEPSTGKTLDLPTAIALLEEAGGDRKKAEQLARERGYKW